MPNLPGSPFLLPPPPTSPERLPFGYPPGVGAQPQPRSVQSGRPAETPMSPATHPVWQEPAGWLRLGVSTGILPLVGRLRYNFVYHGNLLDTHYDPTRQRPNIAVFAEARVARLLFVGLSVQLIALKWSMSYGDKYDTTAYELDFLPRVGLSLPASSRLRLLFSAAPGYSIVDVSDVVLGVYTPPSTLRGFVVQVDAGVLFFFTQHGFVRAGALVQWGFQNASLTSNTTNLTATAELRSTLFGIQTGIGYWF
jgi:hypothetical protein